VTAKIIPIMSEAEVAWAAFIEARDLAETTGKLEDGIAAKRALAVFNALFVPELYRNRRG